jgi:hypothetical protein
VLTNSNLFGQSAIAFGAAIEPDTKQFLRNIFRYLGGFQRDPVSRRAIGLRRMATTATWAPFGAETLCQG